MSHPWHNEADRGIIYCSTKKLAEDIFQHLNTTLGNYFAVFTGALDTNDKASIFKSWRVGSVKWMIATTAFGMGLDYPSVRYVFHAGQSYSMEDYHQETGRLSRDGKKGIAICVTSPDFVDNERCDVCISPLEYYRFHFVVFFQWLKKRLAAGSGTDLHG